MCLCDMSHWYVWCRPIPYKRRMEAHICIWISILIYTYIYHVYVYICTYVHTHTHTHIDIYDVDRYLEIRRIRQDVDWLVGVASMSRDSCMCVTWLDGRGIMSTVPWWTAGGNINVYVYTYIYIYYLNACINIYMHTHTCICVYSTSTDALASHVCDMTHVYMRHDSYVGVTCMWHDSCICAAWLVGRKDVVRYLKNSGWTHLFTRIYIHIHISREMTHVYVRYGVATISRLLKIIGLFCKISSVL